MKKVLLAANISDSFKTLLLEKGYELVIYNGNNLTHDVSGIVTSTKLTLDKGLLSQLRRLEWIARLGSGIEIIDTNYCSANNIALASSPKGIANAVGEHCVAMLVALQKNIASSYYELKNNQWLREPNRGWEIYGKTIGLIGYGHTGQAFANKLRGFDCNIMSYDKYQDGFETKSVKQVSLKELQGSADVISFHIPANQETHHYYNQDFLQACKPHIVMNTSRGDIVSTDVLLNGLQDKKVLGAALDVIEKEHLLSDSNNKHWKVVEQLLSYNTIITPHIAGYSYDAIQKMSAELINKLKEVI